MSPIRVISTISAWKLPVAVSPPVLVTFALILSSVKTSKKESTPAGSSPAGPASMSVTVMSKKTSKNESTVKLSPSGGSALDWPVGTIRTRSSWRRVPAAGSTTLTGPVESYTASGFGNTSGADVTTLGLYGSGAVGLSIATASSGASDSGSRRRVSHPNSCSGCMPASYIAEMLTQ